MTDLDSQYFDLYKDVDNIVKDAYKSDKGLSYYIEFMDELDDKNYEKCCRVPNWKQRRKALKHLRWVRNQISHEKGSAFATQNDYNGLQAFKSELLNGDDPLAEYRQYNANEFNKKKNVSYYDSYKKQDKLELGAWWLVPIAVIAIFCLLAFFGLK